METPKPENNNSNTFAEYGMLMLHELKRLNSGQEDLKKDLDQMKFQRQEPLQIYLAIKIKSLFGG